MHVHIDLCRSDGLHGQTVQRAVQHEDGSTKTDAAMRRGGQRERRERVRQKRSCQIRAMLWRVLVCEREEGELAVLAVTFRNPKYNPGQKARRAVA